MPDADSPAEHGGATSPHWFFWCFAALSLLLFLGSDGIWPNEARFAESAREMLASENLRGITLNGEPVPWRPVGSYYAILFFAWLTGTLDELAVRLPSVIAALLALFAVRRMGTRLFGEAVGVGAGWLLLGCGGFLLLGRTGGADMANAAAILLAAAWFYARRKHPDFLAYFLFYGILFFGAQFKGIPAVCPVFLLIAPTLLRDGLWKKQINFSHPAAFLLAASFYFVPHYLLFLGGTEEFFRQTLGGASVEKLRAASEIADNWHQVFPYCGKLLLELLPWTLPLLVAVAALAEDYRNLPPQVKDFFSGTALLLAFLLFLPSRHARYLLLLLPCICLLGSCALLSEDFGRPRWCAAVLRFMHGIIVVAAAVAVISLIALPFWRRILGFSLPYPFTLTVALVGLLALLVLLADEFGKRETIRRLSHLDGEAGSLFLAGNILCCGFFSVLQLQYYEPATSRAFLREMSEQLSRVEPENMLYWGDSPSLRLLFYLRCHTPLACADSPDSLRRALEKANGRLVLLCSTNPEKQASLRAAAVQCGIPLDLENPSYREERRPFEPEAKDKLVVYFLDSKPKDGL